MLGPLDLLVPPTVLLTSFATLPFTVINRLVTNHASDLGHWPALKHAWFKHFWSWFGPASKSLFAPGVRPLLAQAKGVVLDIGPASGVWMAEFGNAVKRNPGQIRQIYGIEPNVLFHDQLRARAKQYGLADIYEPIGAYAQDLDKHGIEKGSVDTIITVHVLCSVGNQATQITKQLYEYLKPGGQWLVFEHVAARNAFVRAWQTLHNTIWPILLDGCDITRNTEEVLRNAGAWESVAIGPDAREGYFEGLPHIKGKLIK